MFEKDIYYHKQIQNNMIFLKFMKIRNPARICEWCENTWGENDTWGFCQWEQTYYLRMNTHEQYTMFNLAWN